jgi:hypothetical protein
MPDGTPASGTVTFGLSKRMTNGTDSIMPGEVVATLSGSGQLSQALASNADAGTAPADAQWRCDIKIAGAESETYWLTIPATASADLGSLLVGIDG